MDSDLSLAQLAAASLLSQTECTKFGPGIAISSIYTSLE